MTGSPRRSPLPFILATLVTLAAVGRAPPALAAIPPPPGQVPFDEVRLPSGGFVRGQIEEIVPGRYIVLRKPNGKVRRFEWSEIASVSKADGTVISRDDVATLPDPVPDPVPVPVPVEEPDPEPDPLAEPDPDPLAEAETDELASDDPALGSIDDQLGLELDLDSEPDPLAGLGPSIVLNVDRNGPPVSLHRTDDASHALCVAPCEEGIEPRPGSFFVSSDGKRLGKQFPLSWDAPSYRVDVKRHSPVRQWSGVALIPAALLIGIGVGIIPAIHNVPKSKVAGYAVGGAVISLAGIGGGVTLLLFSRSKVQVMPGSGVARRGRSSRRTTALAPAATRKGRS